MTRLGDVVYFLRQIFFPNWKDREDDSTPTGLQKILVMVALYLASKGGTGTLFSIILHAFILAVLSLIMIPKMSGFTGIDILSGISVPGIEQVINTGPANGDPTDNGNHLQNTAQIDTPSTSDTTDPVEPGNGTDTGMEPVNVVPGEGDRQVEGRGGFVRGGGYGNRNSGGRRGTTGGGGGTGQRGEDAVEAALKWLVTHQDKNDGGWSFNFENSCTLCSHSGTGLVDRRTAATSLALLAFLGAGYTYQEPNPYQQVVDRGLRFLILDPNGGIDGVAIRGDTLRMYSHGLAAIALCEAFAMSREQNPRLALGARAQKALWEIELAQTNYGGWNYRLDQTTREDGGIGGDTSIFSWQLMALKSGQIGGLHVSQSVLYAAQDFLDSVALDGGRRYQYTLGGHPELGIDSPNTCTAIGLLARMYLGWKPGDPFLDDGMKQIARRGPILREGEINLYYIYHATLALHHYGGNDWDAWNREVRELLIQTQSRQGCESGSWYFPDHYCDSGGRLLNTALAVMILETPYRFMPLYRKIR